MPQRPDGQPARPQRVTFTKGSAERIAAVVRDYEAGDRAEAPLRFGSVAVDGGGSKVKLAIYTATSAWVPISPFSTVATNSSNIKTIQFVYPTATAVVSGVTVGIPNGQTAVCINNMAFLPAVTTVTTASITIISVTREAGGWRLLGVSR
jgi:hypothetical protein